ncbi:hypothetical protein CLOP_g22392 [Closterium sp. NIES-67]|nr:hypothetical protein CLOP_g22392 [Closterium sp. NIES-67]
MRAGSPWAAGRPPLQQRGACGARGVDEVQRGVKQRQARRQRHVQTQQAPPRQGLLEWHCHPAAAAAAAAAATGTTHTAAAAAPMLVVTAASAAALPEGHCQASLWPITLDSATAAASAAAAEAKAASLRSMHATSAQPSSGRRGIVISTPRNLPAAHELPLALAEG